MADFYFNFNARGYLAYFLPIYPVFVRRHPNQSGEWGGEEIYNKFEEYLDKVRKLEESFRKEGRTATFVDRNGAPIDS